MSQALKNILQVAQSKTVRLIKSMGPRTSIKQPELSSLGFINVENRLKQLRLNYTHKIFNNAYPFCLKNNFIKIYEHDNHKHNTRSSHFNCVTPKIKGVDSTFYHTCNQGLEIST